MKNALIDIGSNSIRLTLYETSGDSFKVLFREKVMAGLAGYVEGGRLSDEGVERACSGLLTFRSILQTLEIDRISVFATASLRNVSNTAEALARIEAETGYSVDVISGKDEALLGYAGAMRELRLTSGAFVDVGGASTELVEFDGGAPGLSVSLPVGSLSLYRRCVKKILPGDGSLRRLRQAIEEAFDASALDLEPRQVLVGVGGTARATLKLARHYYGDAAIDPEPAASAVAPAAGASSLDPAAGEVSGITAAQLDGLVEFLCSGEKDAADLILRHEADRVHTIVPGMLVLQHAFHLFRARRLVVSKYGVREGYLCQRVLSSTLNSPASPSPSASPSGATPTPRTAS